MGSELIAGVFRRVTTEIDFGTMSFVELLKEVAAHRDVTPVQVEIAWLPADKPRIVPIPDTRRRERVEENLRATAVGLLADDLAAIEQRAATIEVMVERRPAAVLLQMNRNDGWARARPSFRMMIVSIFGSLNTW